MKVAWIGLGVMGGPMARHLTERGGHEVTVFNRTDARAQSWRQANGGRVAPTPAQAAHEADFVFCCVGNDDDLRQVSVGPDGAFSAMRPGSVFVDHTTASAEVARHLATEASARRFQFLDCPVSGGQSGAESGTLTVMAGGAAEAFARAEPLLRCFAKSVRLMGGSGAGQLAKMVNQIAVAGIVQGLSEAMSFAEHAGLDIAAVFETISKGAAQSWQMDNRWRTMHDRKFEFGFAVDWMRKDLRICLEESRRNGASLAITELIDGYYADVQKLGGGRWDTSSLLARLGLPKES